MTTCENCKCAHDEEGLLVCSLDDRVKDDDMCCKEWEPKQTVTLD